MREADHFKTLCCLNLPPQAAMVAIAGALHDIIPSEWNRIGYLTGGPGLGAAYAEHPDCVTLAAKNVALFEGGDPWFAREFQRVCVSGGATGWLGLRQRNGYQNCAVFDAVERPLGSHWVLDATIDNGQRVFAGLILSRPRGMRPFSAEEAARLDALRPWIAHALRDRSPDPPSDDDGPSLAEGRPSTHPLMRATAILDGEGRLLLRSAGADYLLAILAGMTRALEPARTPAELRPDAVQRVVRRLVGAGQGGSNDAVPRLVVPTAWGTVTVEAAWLAPQSVDVVAFAADPGHALIGVTLELREPPAAHAARVLREAGVTPAQLRVGVLLALGKSKPEIARELGVKPASVEDATRKLYGRLHVHNAAELGALVWLGEPARDDDAR